MSDIQSYRLVRDKTTGSLFEEIVWFGGEIDGKLEYRLYLGGYNVNDEFPEVDAIGWTDF